MSLDTEVGAPARDASGAQAFRLQRRSTRKLRLFEPALVRMATVQSFKMLDPREMARNPVMFLVEVGTVLTAIVTVQSIVQHAAIGLIVYQGVLAALLLLTVLFANFASALAEARGKAQADSLRATRADTPAFRLHDLKSASGEIVPSTTLRAGDYVVIEAGQVIPTDGEVVEGVASVDESAITGESAPVIREAGGDHSGVTGGTRVLSDRIVVQVTAEPGQSFLDKMIALVEGAARQKTPNEIALTIVLAAFSLIFLIVTASLYPMARYFGLTLDIATLIALLVCLIPTTIGALLAAIGIAGMDRALAANIIAKSGKAVEVAGDIDTLLLDKTGTITIGNRRATQFFPLNGTSPNDIARVSGLASMADSTPEGKSILDLARQQSAVDGRPPDDATFIEFTAHTRMSGVDLPDGPRLRKGAPNTIAKYVQDQGGGIPDGYQRTVDAIASGGATPLAVAEDDRIVGVIKLEDILKPGISERFARLRQMGLRVVMVTGDNPLTATAIAAEAGVDDFIAQATPEAKLAYIRKEQEGGKLVAMMGDGTNDAPALAQADIGVAMNSGTQAAKEAGNMVDLDSDPTKLIEVVEIGKQLLMTRGALTTFSIANDLAKYFAVIPAMFIVTLPELKVLDVMGLATNGGAYSAILAAVIFNAIIIPLLIPIALKGVKYRPVGAGALLRRNLLVYGLGGVIAPFIGIKLIDVAIDPLLALVGII
ncbi:potassium-transporting ATPase subunit KdpB [Paludisphaera borealis]|uniref:Potassium-transporting ATPase ATP-binding subunit n=1 Tax=Paludisphaera borealis TaxID=1387353 RepID=A0A1U7CJ41_9BACT|nr:potassium-transporting ATPase subunit KdpB [Paludisphaera borealis]APW58951.1 Potassium-transporting ATPase ATP-binding subunit [Paludisphaera borealis]